MTPFLPGSHSLWDPLYLPVHSSQRAQVVSCKTQSPILQEDTQMDVQGVSQSCASSYVNSGVVGVFFGLPTGSQIKTRILIINYE